MEEAERICDRVCLIDGGRLVAEGTVEELIVRAGRWTRVDLTYRGRSPSAGTAISGAQEIRVLANGHGSGRLSLELPNHAQIEGVLDRVRTAGPTCSTSICTAPTSRTRSWP
jgi:ABC-2 type transport system ATP-binding protein